MRNLRLLSILLVILLASSCTLTKRHYRPGYHLTWHHKIPAPASTNVHGTYADVHTSKDSTSPSTTAKINGPEIVLQNGQHPLPVGAGIAQKNKVYRDQHQRLSVFAETNKKVGTAIFATYKSDDLLKEGYEKQAQKSATISLVLSILGLVFLSFFILGLPLSIIALNKGREARAYANPETQPHTLKRAKAGIIISTVTLILYWVALVAGTVLLGVLLANIYITGSLVITALLVGFLVVAFVICGVLSVLFTFFMLRYVFRSY